MLLGITISVGLLAVILTHLFGEWFLVFLFGNAVKGYLPVFYSIIVATVFTSGVICLNAALTAADKQKWALYGNIPGVAICIMLSKFFCQHYFMSGVAYTLIIAQAINALVLGGFLFVVSKSQTKAAL